MEDFSELQNSFQRYNLYIDFFFFIYIFLAVEKIKGLIKCR